MMTNEEAIKTLRELWRETNDTWYEEVYNMAIEALSDLEAKQRVDRPTGEWVDKGGYSECSKCGEVAQKVELCDCVYERLTNFCPNCGASMLRGGAVKNDRPY